MLDVLISVVGENTNGIKFRNPHVSDVFYLNTCYRKLLVEDANSGVNPLTVLAEFDRFVLF
jgi:hypothetical protein